jgi:hypothetical protein
LIDALDDVLSRVWPPINRRDVTLSVAASPATNFLHFRRTHHSLEMAPVLDDRAADASSPWTPERWDMAVSA